MEINEIVEVIKGMTLSQVSELVKALEEEFGVSAASPVAVAAAPVAGAAAPASEEKSEYTVVLKAVDAEKKPATIKVVKEITELGLLDAKKLVDGAPSTIKEGVSPEAAKEMKAKLEECGATVELK